MEVSGQFHVLAALPPGQGHRYQLNRGRVGPTAGFDAVQKRKALFLPGTASSLSCRVHDDGHATRLLAEGVNITRWFAFSEFMLQ